MQCNGPPVRLDAARPRGGCGVTVRIGAHHVGRSRERAGLSLQIVSQAARIELRARRGFADYAAADLWTAVRRRAGASALRLELMNQFLEFRIGFQSFEVGVLLHPVEIIVA